MKETKMTKLRLWERYKKHLCGHQDIGLMVDISRMNFADGFFTIMEPSVQKAFRDMAALEGGAIANPDEQRMVGHYWLRNSELSPSRGIAAEIEFTIRAVQEFAAAVHDGTISPPRGRRFTRMLVVGIGGSALGPQFVADALGSHRDRIKPYFLDNTDPDGMDRIFGEIGGGLAETLTIVISKSGGTKETRNGMLETKQAYATAGLEFAKCAVAVTGRDSELDGIAGREGWLARFPMWDWVGGRTSVTSAVGLLPAALQGIDIAALLDGARRCDVITRQPLTTANPAALLALMWHYATDGRGARDMVVIPYKDQLLLFSRYLQQLIMESIGKERNLAGEVVNQGLAVYGNKGSTDQHAYVQQLREGVNNFFVTFIEVLKDRQGRSLQVETDITSGDYLSGFFQGTRSALHDNGRESITITVNQLDPRTIGVLIALYERAVGLYAFLLNINAYHQPGVEAGKKAAGDVLKRQAAILAFLRAAAGRGFTAEEVAVGIADPSGTEDIFKILLHLSANEDHGVSVRQGENICDSKFHYGKVLRGEP
jgi:glucose-6-phosphate isomerase